MRYLFIICLVFTLAGCEREARFKGRPTSYWIQQLDNPDYMARVHAANALAHIGQEAKPAIPRLIKLLDDNEPLVRWAAATTLGKFGSDAHQAVPALKELAANDSEVFVVDAADWALKRIQVETRKANAAKLE